MPMATSVTVRLSRMAASDGLQKSLWPVLLSAAGTDVFSAAAFFSAFSLCGPPILTRHTPMFMAGAVWGFAQ